MMSHSEQARLDEDRVGGGRWKAWGPYLSERAWGTVREDYSASGAAWDYFPHDQARARAYRWSEDGLAGICDDQQRLCFALALWNGRDPILKERLFGLTGPEGNHGEDVKEQYYYLDSTPSHSYMRMLYKYPQAAYPYSELVEVNRRRSREEREYELLDTGAFDGDRYFDVFVEYAKASPDDILIRLSIVNRGPDLAEIHVLPQLWFRNTWSWGGHAGGARPQLAQAGDGLIVAQHEGLGRYQLACQTDPQVPGLLFTENETNTTRLWGTGDPAAFTKDAFHRAVVDGRADAVNPARIGTKAAAHYRLQIAAGETATLHLRLTGLREAPAALAAPFEDFEELFAARRSEADSFYSALQPPELSEDERAIQRQAFAGMLWSKQFYHYSVADWVKGDPGAPPPAERAFGRNRDWLHLDTAEIISMPDAWEYPWFAAWDLAFHCVPLALVDPDFAKAQLVMLGREWFQHPNGQVPAYEWAFGDVNPPVLAWAALRVYRIEQHQRGQGDRAFLERVYHKLLLNFTWWVNRKDDEGRNLFQGGFLGLDNIGIFDRSAPLPTGGHLHQSDGTSWMGMFSLNMMSIALELATHNPVYEDIASKFFEHFLYIAAAMNNIGGDGLSLWDPEDEFFYDVLHADHVNHRLRIRSMVGLIPLLAVATIEPEALERLPGFRARLEWFLEHRPELAGLVSRWSEPGKGERRLLALLRGHRMKRVLHRLLDEDEFLSPFGVRALSRYHAAHPYVLNVDGNTYAIAYEPAESATGLFGGNSNWRGPIWFPVNYLIIEALREFDAYYSPDFRVEAPTRSGRYLSLGEIADEVSRRLIRIFTRDVNGRRPVFGDVARLQQDAHWRDHVLFYEYFHGENGSGLGASHQTGWTGLVADLIQNLGSR